jgi:hypothetical protein
MISHAHGTLLTLGLVTALSATAPSLAQAEPADDTPPAETQRARFSYLGHARRIANDWSASRDTPTLEMQIFPHAGVNAGGQFALATARWTDWTLRTGFAGGFHFESEGDTDSVNSGPFPSGTGKILWRGSYAYFAAASLDTVGLRLCSGCALELTLAYRHESDHYTGSNYGGGGRDFTHQPYVGDAVIADVALSQRMGTWYFAQRVTGMGYLPDRSSYSAGVAMDAHVRWTGMSWAHPFVSAFAEYRSGDELRDVRFPSLYRVRSMWGVALPSDVGDIMVFGTADIGHRYGLQALTEEAALGLGVRLVVGGYAVERASAGR